MPPPPATVVTMKWTNDDGEEVVEQWDCSENDTTFSALALDALGGPPGCKVMLMDERGVTTLASTAVKEKHLVF